jgi:hypothetical protein
LSDKPGDKGDKKDKAAEKPASQRRGFMRALAAELPRVAAPVLGKHGFSEAQMVSHWSAVVGEDLARRLAPERLSFTRGERRDGTLRLRVDPGFALEAQHREPQILERINAFFGYRAVARLTLIQGPLPRAAAPRYRPPRKLAETERATLDRSLAGITDAGLRDALQRLGEAVIGTDASPRSDKL